MKLWRYCPARWVVSDGQLLWRNINRIFALNTPTDLSLCVEGLKISVHKYLTHSHLRKKVKCHGHMRFKNGTSSFNFCTVFCESHTWIYKTSNVGRITSGLEHFPGQVTSSNLWKLSCDRKLHFSCPIILKALILNRTQD